MDRFMVELVAGFSIGEVKDMDEAVDCTNRRGPSPFVSRCLEGRQTPIRL